MNQTATEWDFEDRRAGENLESRKRKAEMGGESADDADGRRFGRLPVETVERLHRLLGGDAQVEGMVLRFIADKYGARNLFYLPPHVAREILKRPADFLRAAKEYCEPEVGF